MDTSRAIFVPTVALTRDDDDTNSFVSDIPLQVPRVQMFRRTNSALVTFSQVEGDKSRSDAESDWCKSLAITVFFYIHSRCNCSSWTSRTFKWQDNEREKHWMISATLLAVLYFINKKNF